MEKVNSNEILQLVSFTLGDEEFGVDILKVQEINRINQQITKVPNAPEYVEGVINLRGRIIPVLSLRTRIGLPKIENNKDSRIIVVELEAKTIGFIVDSVSEVLRIPATVTEAPPSIAAGVNAEYITSIAKLEDRLLILLDLEKVLLNQEKIELQQLELN